MAQMKGRLLAIAQVRRRGKSEAHGIWFASRSHIGGSERL